MYFVSEKKGKYILFEGVDGCGKSTQLGLLNDLLLDNAYNKDDIVYLREPGGNKIGEKIRTILLDKKNDKMTSITELFLFEASRSQSFEQNIYPGLKEGKIFLADRSYYSTIAYQGYGRGMDRDMIKNMNDIATKNFQPDLALIFDIPVEISLTRTGKDVGKDRMELAGLDFFNRVRKGYLNMKNIYSNHNIHIIDASRSIEEIAYDIKNLAKKYIL